MSYPGVHICVIYGTDGGPNRIWSLALAVGFITFREGNGIALAVLIVVAFVLQLLHAIHMAGGLSYLNVTNGLFMIAIIVFAGLLGLLLSMMMRRQQTREQAHERMLKRERQEHHAQTLDYAAQVHDRISGRLANISMICSRHIGERGTLLTRILAMPRIGDWWHLRWPIHWRMLTPSSHSVISLHHRAHVGNPVAREHDSGGRCIR